MRIRYIGGPTAIVDIGGLRLLTDPTFDPPGEYPIGTRSLTKTIGPALSADAVGRVDVVLLSHDQHPDNLDRSGRDYLAGVPLVLTTASAQGRLSETVHAQVLANWRYTELACPSGGLLRVTGVPAQHGPDGSEPLVGEVTGFVLTGPGLPTVYVSGDNASLDVVRAIAERFAPFDVAVLFAGGAKTALLGDAFLTLSSPLAASAAQLLAATHIVPVHFEGWAHFTEGRDTLPSAFQEAGLADRLHLLAPGEQFTFSRG